MSPKGVALPKGVMKDLVLVGSIEAELALGTKHYRRKTGQLLEEVKEIVRVLVDDGPDSIRIEPASDRKHLFPGNEPS
jgi:hypothetical protein